MRAGAAAGRGSDGEEGRGRGGGGREEGGFYRGKVAGKWRRQAGVARTTAALANTSSHDSPSQIGQYIGGSCVESPSNLS